MAKNARGCVPKTSHFWSCTRETCTVVHAHHLGRYAEPSGARVYRYGPVTKSKLFYAVNQVSIRISEEVRTGRNLQKSNAVIRLKNLLPHIQELKPRFSNFGISFLSHSQDLPRRVSRRG